jgi:anthranilate/para-aminobenzoate synthase component II
MILVIDNYDSFTWNLVHYLMELGAEVDVVRNDALSAGQAISTGAQGFLISPGPCTPNEAGISLDLVGAAADARRVPGAPVDRPALRRQGGARRADAREDLAGHA